MSTGRDADVDERASDDGSGTAGKPWSVEVPRPLLDLTDEEIAVLFGADQGAVATPYLDAIPAAARATALHTAYRCLLANGLVDAPQADSVEDAAERAQQSGSGDLELEVEMDGVLADIVKLRDGAPVLLCLQRTLADGQALRYAHIVGDFVLVEDVLPTGLHRFGWVEREDLASCLQAFLVPAEAVDGPVGEGAGVLRVTGDGAHGREPLSQAMVSVDATVRHVGDDGPGVMLGLFIGPAGTWVTRNRFGEPGEVTFEPVRASMVGLMVQELVSGAEQAVRDVTRQVEASP